jgi:hypothetical protein
MVYVLVGLLSRLDDFRVPGLVGAGADLGFFVLCVALNLGEQQVPCFWYC